MTPLTGTQLALLAIHAFFVCICVLSFVDDIRTRAAKAHLLNKDILKPLRPGDIAIIHFSHEISDRTYAALKEIFEGAPHLRDGGMVALGECSSVVVLQLAENLNNASDDGKECSNEAASAGNKPIEASEDPA